jgi:predicted enzyme related to lactoylglutathione lyase
MKFKIFSLFPLGLTAIILLLLCLLSGCAEKEMIGSREVLLPPVSAEATGIYHPGRFVWVDLITPDLQAAQEFYGKLFGWTFLKHEKYYEVFNGKRRIACLVAVEPKDGENATAQWLPSMSVPDVDEAVDRAAANGGKVINGPVDMPLRGRGALLLDLEGASFVVLHAKDGDPEERQPGIGDWLWVENWSAGLIKAVDFYKAIGQYDATLAGKDYVILLNEDRWRAGIRKVKQVEFSGQWVPVVRVKDPAATAAQVESLGGLVWLNPDDSQTSSDTVLISDNTGALLILQRWTFPAEGDK